MLIFFEFLLVGLCGLSLTHMSSKTANKRPFASFCSMCFGTAMLITFFIISALIHPIIQHAFVVIAIVLTLGNFKEFKKRLES